MKKGLSLVELLMTLSLALIMGTIIYGTYNKLRSRSTTIVQNRDQMVLKQVMETFHVMGGSVAKITADSTVSMEAKALALTNLLQNNGGSSSQSRVLKGVVGAGISSDMVVVAYAPNVGADDGRVRLVIDNSTGNLMAATTGAGFVVVSKSQNSSMVPSAASNASNQPAANALISAVNSDLNTVKGMHYADSNAYVWNEDTTVAAGPGSGTVTSTGPSGVSTPLATLLIDTPVFSGSPFNVSGGVASYSSWEYQNDPAITFFVRRSDNKPLYVTDVTSSATVNGSNSGFLSSVSQASVSGVVGVRVVVSGLKNIRNFNLGASYSPGQSDINHAVGVVINPANPSNVGMVGVTANPVSSSVTVKAIHPAKPVLVPLAGSFQAGAYHYTYSSYLNANIQLCWDDNTSVPISGADLNFMSFSIGNLPAKVALGSINTAFPAASWTIATPTLSSNVVINSGGLANSSRSVAAGTYNASCVLAADKTALSVALTSNAANNELVTNNWITLSASPAAGAVPPANWMSVSGSVDWMGSGAPSSMPTYISPLAQNGQNGTFSTSGTSLTISRTGAAL